MLAACRVRPSDINKSYAFPSGHSTSAVFILGTLLFVILPLCVAGICPHSSPAHQACTCLRLAHPVSVRYVSDVWVLLQHASQLSM